MSGEITVVTSDLNQMSATQQEAAAGFARASSATATADVGVAESHGLACAQSLLALSQANAARESACAAMQKTSSELAANLIGAASRYAGTDAQGANALDRTMQH